MLRLRSISPLLALCAALAVAAPSGAVAQVTPFTQSLAEAAAADDTISAFYQARAYAPFWTLPEQAARRAALFAALERQGGCGHPARGHA